MRIQTILSLFSIILLSSCSSDPGQDNAVMKNILLLILVLGVLAVIGANKRTKAENEKRKQDREAFTEKFNAELEKENLQTSKNITSFPPVFGLVIADNLQSLAYYTNEKLNIINRSQIIKTECSITNNEHINSKTKAPIVSMTAQANTKGEIIKSFAFAELHISLNSIDTHLIKLKFYSKDEAEKYNALINLMITDSNLTT